MNFKPLATNVRRLAVVTEFKKPKMNKEDFLLELSKAIAVDGRVNVDRYCRVVELIDTYISINYGKPIVIRSVCDCGNELTEKELFYETCLKCNKVLEQTDV